jgi:hypothetical protein
MGLFRREIMLLQPASFTQSVSGDGQNFDGQAPDPTGIEVSPTGFFWGANQPHGGMFDLQAMGLTSTQYQLTRYVVEVDGVSSWSLDRINADGDVENIDKGAASGNRNKSANFALDPTDKIRFMTSGDRTKSARVILTLAKK